MCPSNCTAAVGQQLMSSLSQPMRHLDRLDLTLVPEGSRGYKQRIRNEKSPKNSVGSHTNSYYPKTPLG